MGIEVNLNHFGFNNIKSNLKLQKSEDDKVLLFTSILPDEGKTEVAFNTALQFVNAGQSVIYLDLNLKNTKSNVYLNSPKENILSYLDGNNSINEVINKYNIEDISLDYIARGLTEENTSNLFENRKFKDLIEYLRGCYDIVILDSPVTNGIPDAKIIANESDAIIIVIRKDRAKINQIKKAINELSNMHISFISAVYFDNTK